MTLIALEGIDSSGKATQAGRLRSALADTPQRRVWQYAFPRYDTPIGQVLLRLLKGETFLARWDPSVGYGSGIDDQGRAVAAADSLDQLLILRALFLTDKYDAMGSYRSFGRESDVVICDRWIGSSIAYGMADGLSREWLDSIHHALPKADLNIFIDVPPEEALKRRPEMRDRYERDRLKQAVVRSNYTSMAQDTRRWALVDGVGTPDEVHQRIVTAIRRSGVVNL